MSNPNIPGAITVDWRPVWWSLTWSCILAFVPTIVLAARVSSTTFTLADDALMVRTGIVTKKSQHIELYRVRDIASSESVFSGGKVTLTLQDGVVHVAQPIQDADAIATRIRALVNAAKASRNVQHREDL